MEQNNPLVFEVRLTVKDIWKFSIYHSYKGMPGIFNAIFSLAAVFLIATRWSESSGVYQALYIVCLMMFTVWQPFLLYIKAARQAKNPVAANAMTLDFRNEGLLVSQGENSLELIWENIAQAERAGSMVIIYMDKIHAYLLPDSIMGDRKNQLEELLREHLPKERRKRI